VIVVADTSVILNLCFLREENLLPGIFGRIVATESVFNEFTSLAATDSRFERLEFPGFLEILKPVSILPGLIGDVGSHLQRLREDAGFWISPSLLKRVLEISAE
jgi:predicted nucleic acid-binding protein